MSRLALNSLCALVVLAGGASESYAADEEGGSCSETNYFHCSGTTCVAHQPCSIEPGDAYTGCSNIPSSGWYSRIKFNTFDCSA